MVETSNPHHPNVTPLSIEVDLESSFKILLLVHYGDRFVQLCADKAVKISPIGVEVILHVFVISSTPRALNLGHSSWSYQC